MRQTFGDDCIVQDVVTSKPPARIKLDRMEPVASRRASKNPSQDEGSSELEELLGQARPVEIPQPEVHSRPQWGFD